MSDRAVRPSRAGVAARPAEETAAYIARGYWEGRSLGEHLYAAAGAAPDAVCLVDGPVRLSFAELMARADGAAVRLRGLGLRADDRVVLQLPNCWELVVLMVACLRLGVIPAMALPAHRRREIAAVAERTEAVALIVPDSAGGFDLQAMAREVAGDAGVEHVLVLGDDVRDGSVDVRALCEPAADPGRARRALEAAAPPGEAVAWFMLSGGTTGTPKLIPRTHDDLAYMMKRSAELCGFDAGTVYLAVLPMGHGFPMTGPGVLGALLAGGRAVILPSPAAEQAFTAIEAEGVTATSVVPAIVQRWLEHRAADPRHDLGSLRLLQSGASRLADTVARRIAPAFGCTLQQVYGMSEGLLCFTRPDDPEEVLWHTQGRPICPDDELLLVDEDGEPVPEGEPGVLLTRGPYTTRGYYRAEELNARAFVGDGWYRTGDVVRRRPDGNLVVEGRDKDVINRGGEKISAEEVEEFAYRTGAVRQAAAVAMPDPELGERICLYATLRPGRTVELGEVRAVMEQAGVARFKLPERLVIVDDLPYTAIGKPDKKALRADIGRRLAEEMSQAPVSPV